MRHLTPIYHTSLRIYNIIYILFEHGRFFKFLPESQRHPESGFWQVTITCSRGGLPTTSVMSGSCTRVVATRDGRVAVTLHFLSSSPGPTGCPFDVACRFVEPPTVVIFCVPCVPPRKQNVLFLRSGLTRISVRPETCCLGGGVWGHAPGCMA